MRRRACNRYLLIPSHCNWPPLIAQPPDRRFTSLVLLPRNIAKFMGATTSSAQRVRGCLTFLVEASPRNLPRTPTLTLSRPRTTRIVLLMPRDKGKQRRQRPKPKKPRTRKKKRKRIP